MKLIRLIFILVFLILPLGSSFAQAAGQPVEPLPERVESKSGIHGSYEFEEDEFAPPKPDRTIFPTNGFEENEEAIDPAATQVAIGKPGLTFSHVKSYGEAETGYIADTSHFIYPYGVYASGTTVWLADSEGRRALKFNTSGVYQNLTIGKAGFREYYSDDDISLQNIYDVGVDSSGDVWLVDYGASYVPVFNSSGEFQFSVGEDWEDDFSDPRGIAFDSSDNVYISDSGNNRIQIFDNDGNYLSTLGSYGSGDFNFNQPWHIDIYDDHLFVADRYNHRIQIYNVSNPLSITYVGKLGTGTSGDANGQFYRPRGVAVTSSFVYVADTGNDRVEIFRNTTGYSYYAKFGSEGNGHGQFSGPMDVAVDGSGNIYIADCYNFRIEQFSSSRSYIRTFGTTGVPYLTDQYHYFDPQGVALDKDGAVYIAEGWGHRVVKLKSDGTPLWSVGEPGVYGDDNNHFTYPEGIAVSQDGRVFVADANNDRIQVFESTGGGYMNTLGEYGTGAGQFSYPTGVAVDKNGKVYVADQNNCRFQVFDSSLNYLAQKGSCGTGTSQFNTARDIAVDSTGRIYVVDTNNHRVLYFDANLNYQGMIGLTGSASNRYDRLDYPIAITVDAKDQVYIADTWGSSVKVYDKDGKFLDIIKNAWSSFQGGFFQIKGIVVDAGGSLYLADEIGHQVKKYSPTAYPGWRQVNVAGFGNQYNWATWSMTEFMDTLYVGTGAWTGYGAELYYLENGDWTQAMSGGFGDSANLAIDSFETFNGSLYAGTWNETNSGYNGGQLWRSSTPKTGGWSKVVDGGFGSTTNGEIQSLKAFNSWLYAGTWSYDMSDHGAEIYRSDTGDTGDWEKVFDDSTSGHDPSVAIMVMELFNGYLYAGTYNYTDTEGAELWRTSDGTTWEQVNTDGFGESYNFEISSLTEFDGKLYVGTNNYNSSSEKSDGGQIWRSENGTTWDKVVDGGFGDPDNVYINSLTNYRDQMYAVTYQYNYSNGNETKGMEVWRSSSGDLNSWERVGWHAFGKEYYSARPGGYDSASIVFDDQLYIGTYASSVSGGRIFSYLPEAIYLPITIR